MYFLICFIFAIIILLNHELISKKINIIDKADKVRKLHKLNVPQIGGVYIYFALTVYVIYEILFGPNNIYQYDILILYIFSFFFFLLGIVDDKFNLNANMKIVSFTLLIFILINLNSNILIQEVRLNFLSVKFGLGNFSYFWTLICFLLFINAFNMFDGINLQSGLYSFSILLYFFLLTEKFDILILTLLIFLILFLYLNYHSRVFLGNNGTYFVSFLISFIAIHSYNSEGKIFADEIVLLMIIPGLDLIRLFFTRIKEKKHPFQADRSHLHHLLQKKFNDFQVFLIIYIVTWLPIIIAKLFNLFFILIIFQFVVYFSIFIYFKKLNFSKKKIL